MKEISLLFLLFPLIAYADVSESEKVIQLRQELFDRLKVEFRQLRFEIVLRSEFDPSKAESYAQKVSAISQNLPATFNVRSDSGKTKARSEIWENKARFNQRMARFQQHIEAIAEALKYQNREDAIDSVNQAAKSCKSCHRLFKKR